MPLKLDNQSHRLLEQVHPDLRRAVMRAAEISPIPFKVTEGMRTLARQKQLKAKGLSKTLNSRHLTGHAVDIVPVVDVTGDGRVTGEDMWHHASLVKLAPYIKRGFNDEKVPFEWGGDWKNAWDKPHWQLPWRSHPIRTASLTGLSEDLTEAMVEDPMETPIVTPNAAALIGKGSAGLAGAGLLTETATQLQQAEGHFNTGSIFGLVIGTLVTLGALYALWDQMGRPTFGLGGPKPEAVG